MSSRNNPALSARLIQRLPELASSFEDELEKEGRPGDIVVFEVLGRFLVSLLESDGDDLRLRRGFAFVEELAQHQNPHVREMLQITVLRRLDRSDALLNKARKYMHPDTRRLSDHIHEIDKIPERLVERVPQLCPAYESELRDWEPDVPGAINIFDNVVAPFLISLLEGERDVEILQKIFSFLEELANHEDKHVQDIVGVSILERLSSEPLLTKARRYMGSATRRMSDDIIAWRPRQA